MFIRAGWSVVALLCLLEGVDGGSKTTTANAIRDYWPDVGSPRDFQLIHTGPPEPPGRCVYQEYESQLDSQAERVMSDSHLTVLDRWHLGDRIYGPRYRGFARYTEGGLLHTEMALSSFGAVKVICSPSLEVVQERVKNRGDDYIDISDLPRIHAEYLEHAHQYGYTIITGQESQQRPPKSVADTISSLLATARSNARRARELAKHSAGTYTGALYPDCIIAGDELGGTPDSRVGDRAFNRPFTPASPKTSAEWLMSALYKTGFYNTIGMVNVNHPGVDVALIAKVTAPQAGWVALGAKASKTLDSHKIWHNTVPHPAWAKRFKSAELNDYAEKLKHAISAEVVLGSASHLMV
jgi:thymidylate kinase